MRPTFLPTFEIQSSVITRLCFIGERCFANTGAFRTKIRYRVRHLDITSDDHEAATDGEKCTEATEGVREAKGNEMFVL
jgi:hypothetical protein